MRAYELQPGERRELKLTASQEALPAIVAVLAAIYPLLRQPLPSISNWRIHHPV